MPDSTCPERLSDRTVRRIYRPPQQPSSLRVKYSQPQIGIANILGRSQFDLRGSRRSALTCRMVPPSTSYRISLYFQTATMNPSSGQATLLAMHDEYRGPKSASRRSWITWIEKKNDSSILLHVTEDTSLSQVEGGEREFPARSALWLEASENVGE